MASAAKSMDQRRVRIGSVEPAVVALLKQLDPLIVLLTLFGCELAYRDRFTPALGAYATLAFIITGQLFERLDFREVGHSFSDFSRTYARLLRPKLAEIMPRPEPVPSALRTAFDRLNAAIDACCKEERLAA